MTQDSLDTIGLRREVPQASDRLDYLSAYEAAVATMATPLTDIVIVARADATALGNTFAERYPDATVQVLANGKPPDAAPEFDPLPNVHVQRWQRTDDLPPILSALPRPQLLVLSLRRRTAGKVGALHQVHGYVPAGGILAVEHIDRSRKDTSKARYGDSVREVLEDAARRSKRPPAKHGWVTWIDALAQSLEDVTFHGQLALVTKRETVRRMLRTAETAGVLEARFGDDSPLAVLESRPGFTFESTSVVTSHGRGPEIAHGPFSIPPLELRHYSRALSYPRQLLSYDDFWLPDSFRHQHAPRLRHRGLLRANPDLALERASWRPSQVRRWDGPVFYLDTEFPGHFGHVNTEVISRMWGWERAREEFPDIRPLVSLRAEQTAVPSYVRALFDAYGIPSSSLVVQQGDEALDLEDVVAADPQFENPLYAAPEIAQTWERIRASFSSVEPPLRAERIFVTRRSKRLCLQAPQVEKFFAAHGFAVVSPEKYSYGEQVQLFAQARIVAGYGGSGMFTMMHAPDARVILISGDGYSAQNEALIAAVNGNELHYFWGKTQRTEPDPNERRIPFGDDFTFNLRRHRRALRRLLK